MEVDGGKIMRLIEHYGKEKEYPEKSYLRMFTDDFDLNYTQWAAYTRGDQNLGIKILEKLMEIFPDLNLNWLLKDEPNTFISKNLSQVAEPAAKYNVKDPMARIEAKLDAIHDDVKKVLSSHKLSQN